MKTAAKLALTIAVAVLIGNGVLAAFIYVGHAPIWVGWLADAGVGYVVGAIGYKLLFRRVAK